MSWLFGRRKQQKDCPEEEQASDRSEEFVHLAKWSENQDRDTVAYPAGNLYPRVPPVPDFGRAGSDETSREPGQGDGFTYLTGVPFKLCKRLETSIGTDTEMDKLGIDEILSFIERIEKQNYDYSFSLEEGIVAEMNSGREQ